MKCVLCKLKLTSETMVKEHVKVCWTLNKAKHLYCTICKKTYSCPFSLNRHCNKFHSPIISTPSREIAQVIDGNNDAKAADFNSNEEEAQNHSTYNTFSSEADPSASRPRYSPRRHKSKVNYSETQACRGCEKDFYTVEDLEDHDPDPTKATESFTISRKSPIKCMLCNSKLRTEVSLKTHVKMCWRYHKKVHRYCVPCEKGFSGKASLIEHSCKKHFPGPEFPYNCTVCRAGFKDRMSKRIHTLSHREFLNRKVHGKYSESSIANNTSKPQETSLGEWLRQQKEENPSNCIVLEPDPLSPAHIFEDVSEANPVKCKLCLRKFTSELVLRSHVRICWTHNRRIHRHCVLCNKTCASIDWLKRHKKLKHSKGPKPIYECNVCGRKYSTLDVCKIHQKSHEDPDKAYPFKCETCHNSFRWKSLLDTHMLSHSLERNFKCPHCPKTFIKKLHLQRHLAIHTLGKEDPTDPSKPSGTSLNCKFCDKFFTLKDKLKDHERTHTGERPYKCKVANCSHTFSSQTYRTIHTKRKHGQQLGLTQFLCSSCGKTFPVQSELDYHIQRFHTEAKDKPFKCPYEGCTKRFGMKFQIAPHLLIHSGEKPFQCEQCGRAFASKQSFKKHQLTHDDEGSGNEIKCDLCPKMFQNCTALKRHLKHHEGEVLTKNTGSKLKFKCEFCGKGYSSKSSLRKHEETHDDDEDESEDEKEEETERNNEESETSESSESENSDQDGDEIENNST